jgi:hypothetical protein
MNKNEYYQSSPDLSRLFAAAVVSPDFCQRLLTNAAEALEAGYDGTTFSLFPAEKALVLSARASTLADFARQVVSGQPVQPERARTRRPIDAVGTAYSGRGIPAIAAFRAP